MSKMGSVFLQLQELGWYTVYQIEEYVNNLRIQEASIEGIEEHIMNVYNFDKNTVTILIGGAKEYKHSKLLKDLEDTDF